MNKTFEPKISPEKYREILLGVELKEIHLESVSTKLNRSEAGPNLSVNTEIKNPKLEILDGEFNVIVPIQLKLKNSSRRIVAKIDSEFYLNFDSKKEITEDFFEIYKRQSLNLNVWPYFRELVSDLTAKMGFNPLVLPLYKQ